MGLDFIFSIAVLIMSVVIHEVSHGYAAYLLGDRTAYYQGRLSANPAKHLDPIGSFLVPTLFYLLGGFIIGWARPVPYNPYNFKIKKWGEAIVAGAGPLSNILVAVLFGLFIRFGNLADSPAILSAAIVVVFINILLAVFNLMPIPPLDGSKLLFSIIPDKALNVRVFLERYALIFLIIYIIFLWRIIIPVVYYVFFLITGMSL